MTIRSQLEASVAHALATLSPENMQRVAEDYARVRFPERFPRFDSRAFDAAGKPTKVAIVACMRKLLTILNEMLKDQALWNAAKHLQPTQTA